MGRINGTALYAAFLSLFTGLISLVVLPALTAILFVISFFCFLGAFSSFNSLDIQNNSSPVQVEKPLTKYEIKRQKATQMRDNPTPAEKRMREILNYEVMPHFPEHVFYSQSVQYGYILDFYCPSLRLGIEVDGESHNSRQGYDWERDHHLQQWGIQILRTDNAQVFNNPDDLINSLRRIVEEKSQHIGRTTTSSSRRYKRTYYPRRY